MSAVPFFSIFFPFVLSRFPSTKMRKNGTAFIILGMCLQSGISLITAKLIFIGIFIFFTSPITGHVTANLARKKGLKPISNNKGKTL